MAIKFEKIQPGMTLYYRFKRKMGNTTMRTLAEGMVSVLEVDATNRRARVRTQAGESWVYASRLCSYFDWSMHGPLAEVEKSFTGAIHKVTKKKAPKAAKQGPTP